MKTLKPSIATLGTTSRIRGWQPDSQRGSRHERGYGWEWEKLRTRILERDHGLCQPCLTKGDTTIATAVDHRLQKADGGTDDEKNLQAICDSCHREKTSRESKRGGG
jgi:5-methylcytosine-specific restriction protein A